MLRDLFVYLRAFSQRWVAIMSGAIGLALTALGIWTKLHASGLFIGAGFVCLFFSGFLVWRDEYKSRPVVEDPRLIAHRETMFKNDLDRLDQQSRGVLRWIVLSRQVPVSWDTDVIAHNTSFLIRDDETYRLVDAYRPLLEKWVAETHLQDPQQSSGSKKDSG